MTQNACTIQPLPWTHEHPWTLEVMNPCTHEILNLDKSPNSKTKLKKTIQTNLRILANPYRQIFGLLIFIKKQYGWNPHNNNKSIRAATRASWRACNMRTAHSRARCVDASRAHAQKQMCCYYVGCNSIVICSDFWESILSIRTSLGFWDLCGQHCCFNSCNSNNQQKSYRNEMK